MATKVSMEGLVEIASHEAVVNAPYRDSKNILTVGIGHTASAGPPDPAAKRGEYSMTEIMDIFARDIALFEARVRKAFTRPLNQRQFDAAVSFDFNTGAIDRATWVKKFNAGDMAGARKSFMDWRKPAEIIPRRRKERDLFFDGKYSSGGYANLYPASASGKVLWSRGQRIDIAALMSRENEPHTAPEPSPRPTTPEKPKSPSAKPAGGIAAIIMAAGIALAAFWDRVTTWIGSLF